MIATTRGDLLRGQTTDALGDTIDDNEGEIGHFVTIPATYTPWVTTRRNERLNPSIETSIGSYLAGASTVSRVARPVVDPLFGSWRGQAVATTAGAASANGSVGSYFPVVPGEKIAFSVVVAVDAAAALVGRLAFLRLTYIDGAGAQVGSGALSAKVVQTEVEMRISGIFTVPNTPTIVSARPDILLDAALGAVGHVLFFDASLVEHSDVVGDYFDGNTPGTDLMRTSWTGTANTTASIMETRSVDVPEHEQWIIDKPTAVVKADFPVSIIEKSRNEFDQASNTWRSVRYYAGRVKSNVPVKAGDRIRDNVSGSIYTVGEVESMARGLSGRSSVTLTMKRTAP